MKKNTPNRHSLSKASSKGNNPGINELLSIMARLRGPSGCPWDREQTEQTLKKYLIEEAYEVLEAIERRKPNELKEELGDLLLQIVFLSRIAAEKRRFGFTDVVQSLVRKLIRRHPHIFPSPHLKVSVLPGTAAKFEKSGGRSRGRRPRADRKNSCSKGCLWACPL